LWFAKRYACAKVDPVEEGPMLRSLGCSLWCAAWLAACAPTQASPDGGPGEADEDSGLSTEDLDGDGYSPAQGDCNDGNPDVHPGAADDTCDGVDNDCNGRVDDPFDTDDDGWSTCRGDCDDGDATTYPGAPEDLNGVDQDCDGIADNNRPDTDDDGDGFTELDGDCDDAEYLVNPGAVEVNEIDDGMGGLEPEGVDNDCDGAIDEGQGVCDTGLPVGDPFDQARAMELCNWVSSATFTAGTDARSRNIVPNFGSTYVPFAGATMGVLSTGIAVDASGVGFISPDGGTDFLSVGTHPDPQPDPADGCGMADATEVYDYLALDLQIVVPTNAHAFSYDFNFISGEHPEWVCTEYDDTFLAMLESSGFSGNISFDSAGRPVTINIGFFDVCAVGSAPACTGDAALVGTGHEGGVGGGTGWLTTTAPVEPGETIRLQFVIFDEGDGVYDSLVLLDNFRWEAEGVEGPITVPMEELDRPQVDRARAVAW
jgi:hypothetical protein